MAKTNLYSSRMATALPLEDEEEDAFARPSPTRRSRGRAGNGSGELRFDADPEERFPDGRSQSARAQDMPRLRRRVPVQQESASPAVRFRRFLLRTRIGLVLLFLLILALGGAVFVAMRAVRRFAQSDPHFRIASSSAITIDGTAELSRAELLGVFGADLGRNIFFVPLAQRRAQLEQVPWVKQATVMRLLPDVIRVAITERVPVAFVRLGNRVELVDGDGVILHLAPATLAARHYSFPVVTGLRAEDAPESRASRMALYQRFVAELDAGGQAVSSQLSEVDLEDLQDVRAVVPAQGGDLLLHFGDSEFLARYRSFQAHLAEWRQQYPHLSSIDLRYNQQVVLKMADGAESEASSVDRGASLGAAPAPAPALSPAHHAPAHPAGHPGVHHPAGHGAAHGWRPR